MAEHDTIEFSVDYRIDGIDGPVASCRDAHLDVQPWKQQIEMLLHRQRPDYARSECFTIVAVDDPVIRNASAWQ